MADVIAKIRAGQPIKSGGVVVLGPPLNPIIAEDDRNNYPDTFIAAETARLTGRFRNRLFYTTGAADPADVGG